MIRMNLKSKFLIPVIALIVLGLGVSTAVSYIISKNALKKLIQNQLVIMTNSSVKQLDSWVTIVKKDISRWSEMNYFKMAVRETFMGKAARKSGNRYLENEKKVYLFYDSLYVANAKGQVISSSEPDKNRFFDVSDQPYFREAIQGHIFISDAFPGFLTEKPVFAVSSPIRDKDAIVGVLFGFVNIEYFSTTYLDSATMGRKGYTVIIDREGVVISHIDRSMVLKPETAKFNHHQKMIKEREGFLEFSFKGVKKLIAFEKHADTGWTIITAVDFSDVMAPVQWVGYINLFIITLTILIAAVIAAIFTRLVSMPLKKAADLADAVRQGDFSKRLNATAKDEIGQLSYALDIMAEQLHEYTSSLAAANQKSLEHTHFLESMGLIDTAIRKAADLDQMMNDVLQTVLEIFQCDRAWLLYPCDPDTSSWRVIMECTRPEYPGACAAKDEYPISAELADGFRQLLESSDPITAEIKPGEHDWNKENAIRSNISMALQPRLGRAWQFGLHQCTHTRIWARDEKELFKEIGRRIEDSLSSLLFLRDLKDSEERHRLLMASTPDPVAVYNMNGKVIYLNPAFEKTFGWSHQEQLGKRIDFVPDDNMPETQQAIKRMFAGAKVQAFETRRFTKEGKILDVQLSSSFFNDKYGNPAGNIVFLRDITKFKKLENQLHQAQKMEAIGTLAGGIAHDFNNLLMGIQGRTSLMFMKMDSPEFLHDNLKGIETYVQSAADLTKQLLGFARSGKYDVKPTDMNRLIHKTSDMFARTAREIRINKQFQNGIWPILSDCTQMEQVMLNLFVNARQAMPGGGDLYIRTENVRLEQDQAISFAVKPGKYINITVKDTGIGIDEKTVEKIFDPFFTTKDVGRGTGLGLASVYGIIENHEGTIRVSSEKGAGAEFSIFLPATEKGIVSEPAVEMKTIRGKEKILVIDDEKIVLDVGKDLLEALGYSVLTAGGGREGLKIYKAEHERIDLVILDMVMSDMNGGETFDRLKALYPNVKVILSSGYSIDGQATEILNRGCRGFIQKPFNLQKLSQKIREALS
ncbi:PAS domain S-box protein [Desulfococcaceae bacterium HSG9]|nr:PAS domain S-box protein [Desulfococcaceae bacterium HSG9]